MVIDLESIGEIDLHRHGVLEAHAGTGKTFTIAGMVVRLLVERRLAVGEILVVTYTQKAAGELLARIRKGIHDAAEATPDEAVRAHLRQNLANLHEALVGTIHSTCLRLLKSFPFESGLPFATEMRDDPEGIEDCLREALRRDGWKGRFQEPGTLRRVLAERSMESLLGVAVELGVGLLESGTRVHPAGLADMDDASDPNRLAGAFVARWAREGARLWKEKKASQGLVSFQDMLETMDLALDRPPFLAALRGQVKVGIVDEFQDTSARQWSLFRKWFLAPGPEAGNLYLVGDPKQSIYSFQGADVRTYQEACGALAERPGTRLYRLTRNWRSLPTLIEGCNGIFTGASDEGWFLDPDIRYESGTQARPPARIGSPGRILSDDLFRNPVRIARLEGPAETARTAYARRCAAWILWAKGREVDLPNGLEWKSSTLEWSDFAIVAASRAAAKPFQRAMDEAAIPWAFYKQQGVFSSRCALEVRAVLRALHAGGHDMAARSLALATRLLEGDEPTLDTLRGLALERRWARLFRVLTGPSGAAARLLGSPQGDRHWMDLRQVSEYALEYLSAGTGGLPELVEHLGRLKDEREQAVDDRNLLASATDRGRVQVLTMHVSKGLEFPVVFLAGGGWNNKETLRSWIEEGGEGPSLRLMPAFLKDDTKGSVWGAMLQEAKARSDRRQEQEARRLNYVAITRPKLLLVAPCHVKPLKKGLAPQGPLAEALFGQWESPAPGVGFLADPPTEDRAPRAEISAAPMRTDLVRSESDLRKLSLGTRSILQTSYTQVARRAAAVHGLEGRVRRSEEAEPSDEPLSEDLPDAWLPRGARTGDALHEILEAWMDPAQDNSWLLAEEIPERCRIEVGRTVSAHGLDPSLAPRIAALLRDVLTHPLALPGGARIRLCDLAPRDRRPETEFHWAFGADGSPVAPGAAREGWMVGYIDLLFRSGKTWYVLDWKTTSLGRWTARNLEESVREHSYDLQANLYGRTVRSALPPGESFGGGVVLYLRAYADPATRDAGAFALEPCDDARSIDRRVRQWLHEHGRLGGSVEA
jgi:exodeoxyribonuclease V beta subunit